LKAPSHDRADQLPNVLVRLVKYRTICADPPWPLEGVGKFADPRHSRPDALPYHTMSIPEICALPVEGIAEHGAHLWLWTTNAFLKDAFEVMEAWGFTYLTTITWVKPSGFGAYFVSRTQHALFGYYKRCEFPLARYQSNVFFAAPKQHSAKPEGFTDWIETISPEPRVELFARRHRMGWDVWGNESANTATLDPSA
jgi:N6-adenosine-specific RNA methylase IME4